MSKLFFINLKTNLTINQTKDYFDHINSKFANQNNHFVFFINHLSAFLSFNQYNFNLGIQSYFKANLGAYTASNSLEQLKHFTNIKYCLLGHCEELKHFNLSLDDINIKIKDCLSTDLIPVVCFGDDKFQKPQKAIKTLIKQLDVLLKDINNFKELVLAYEPKYAVNSNIEIIPHQIDELFQSLKLELFNKYNHNFKICYGGNVNESNINEFINQDNIDGFLIGRYGLKQDNITQMLKLNK